MIKEFVTAWESRKNEVQKLFEEKHPENYQEVVKNVATILDVVDVERIHEIDDGSYQGTLVYVIGAKGYQPSDYWYVKVDYGSCSGCDTLEAIRDYSSLKPTEGQVSDYMALSLHIIQQLKKMGEEIVYG